MTLMLDVAAGVLIAAFIIGIVVLGLQILEHESQTGGDPVGLWIAVIGVLIWIAFIVCRILRWP